MYDLLKFGLVFTFLVFGKGLLSQDKGYYFTREGTLYEIALSTGETEVRNTFSLVENPFLFDAINAGDTAIYFVARKQVFKYSISRNEFSKIADVPPTAGNSAYFQSVLNLDAIRFELPDLTNTNQGYHTLFSFSTLGLRDLSFQQTGGLSLRHTSASYTLIPRLNALDSTLWIYHSTDGDNRWKQYDELRNEVNNPFFSEGIQRISTNNFAVNRQGDYYIIEEAGENNVLSRVNYLNGARDEVGLLNLSGSGFFMIPLVPHESRSLWLSAPAIGLFSRGREFEPIGWTFKATNTGNTTFTIDSIRWASNEFEIEGETDDLTLEANTEGEFRLVYHPRSEAEVTDVLRVYANSEGLYKEIPIKGEYELSFDERFVETVTPERLLIHETTELSERDAFFEKTGIMASTCATCRHALSPNGRLFRVREESLLEVYDERIDDFILIKNLSEKFNLVRDFAFEDDDRLVVLSASRSTVQGDWKTHYRLWRYDYIADSILVHSGIDDVFDEMENTGKPVAIEYNAAKDRIVVLQQVLGQENQNGLSELLYYDRRIKPSGVVTLHGTMLNDFYIGEASAWFGLEGTDIFHVDLESESVIKVTELDLAPVEVVGYWHGQSSELQVSHSTVDFGSVFAGTSKHARVLLSNSSDRSVEIEEIGLESGVFRLTAQLPLQVPIGNTAISLEIVFEPEMQEAFESVVTLSFTDRDQAWEEVLNLKGTGITSSDVLQFNKSDVDFGEVHLGRDTSSDIELRSLSDRVIQIKQLTFDNESFSVEEALPLTIVSNEGLLVNFRFTPQSAGEISGNAIFMLDDDLKTWEVRIPLSGQGDPWVDIDHTTLNFSRVAVGNERELSVSITNNDQMIATIVQEVSFDNPAFELNTELPVNITNGFNNPTIDFVFKPETETIENGIATMTLKKRTATWQVQIALDGEGVSSDVVTSLEDPKVLNGLRVFPNPASASGHLSFEGVPAGVKELKFFNTHGQLVQTFQTQNRTEFRSDISSFATAGIMLVKFISEDGEYLGFKRILLKR